MTAPKYYELLAGQAVTGPEELGSKRSAEIYAAINKNEEYQLLEMRRVRWSDAGFDVFLVEKKTHGVPPKNRYGIKFIERLAILVGDDPTKLPHVWAMREEFPRLVHQHQMLKGSPASLCLYFEPNSAVLRTWTAGKFLRRISWWLERNAKGNLHAADQPLDDLFFSSGTELILPWHHKQSRLAGYKPTVVRSGTRGEDSFTLRVTYSKEALERSVIDTALIEIELPALTAGAVEFAPSRLGELQELLALRGGDLLAALNQHFDELLDEHGARKGTKDAATVVLVHMPLKRGEDGRIEKFHSRGFFSAVNILDMGAALGALFELDGTYYRATGLIQADPSTAWQQIAVKMLDVLRENDTQAARAQSGLTSEGPVATLVGAGSLGSAMFNLFGRSGWGTWLVMDPDHVKPHNLSRHTAYRQHVGMSKAAVVAELNDAAMGGASTVSALVADATSNTSEIRELLTGRELILDASASLEYPRYASSDKSFSRHASVFVTPSAYSAVAMVEDGSREIGLRTLESQYYRAIITSDWGANHLEGGPTFWSGASCRDISMVMPYSRIMLQASILVEHLPSLIEADEASITIWQSDKEGTIRVVRLPIEEEFDTRLGDLEVYFDAGFERQVRDLRASNLPNETGGVLLGYYDLTVNSLVIVAALPAPPDSKSSQAAFERGVEGLKEAVAEANKRTRGVVEYVGEWHSHPEGHSAKPSGDDLIQLIHLAMGMDDDGLPGVQLIVGEGPLQIAAARLAL